MYPMNLDSMYCQWLLNTIWYLRPATVDIHPQQLHLVATGCDSYSPDALSLGAMSSAC